MRVFESEADIPPILHGAALTIGNFDGVHHGHRALLREARRCASPVGVVTFDPHPREVLGTAQSRFRIGTRAENHEQLARAGADFILLHPFTPATAATTAEAFLTGRCASLSPRAIVVGSGFRFGRNREGDTALIEKLGPQLGYRASIVPPQSRAGRLCSSTAVRQAIATGDFSLAHELLGRRWQPAVSVRSIERIRPDLQLVRADLPDVIRPEGEWFLVHATLASGRSLVARARLDPAHDELLIATSLPEGEAHPPLLRIAFIESLGSEHESPEAAKVAAA